MKDLKCTTANCEHNKLGKCRAGIIHIDTKGFCATKMKRDGGILAQDFSDFEAANAEEPENETDTFVECQANCVFNNNNVCTKDGIKVSDGIFKTKCFSKRN